MHEPDEDGISRREIDKLAPARGCLTAIIGMMALIMFWVVLAVCMN